MLSYLIYDMECFSSIAFLFIVILGWSLDSLRRFWQYGMESILHNIVSNFHFREELSSLNRVLPIQQGPVVQKTNPLLKNNRGYQRAR